jgi:hypothetical protein
VRVSAEVILAPRGGRSLTEGSAQVTADSVEAFLPDERAKTEAKKAFERRGFEVHDSGVSLTIEAEPDTFERELGVRLDVNSQAAPGEAVVTSSGEPQLPEEVQGLVETVAFPKRAHLFGRRPEKGSENHG